MIFSHMPYLAQATILKLTPYFEARERFQRRVNKAFSNARNDNASYYEQRYRLGGSFVYGENLSGTVIYQYANTLAWTAKQNFSFQASDLYVGEADLKTSAGTLKVGRQIISKGGLRLFEESFFGQRSKSFDTVRFQTKNIDLFAGKVGLNPNAADQARLAVGSYDSPLGETMLVYKYDRWLTNENFYTLDQRYVATVGKGRNKIQGEFEGAAERGRYNGLDMNSWFLHGRIGHGTGKMWGTYIEANAYSGGKNKTTSFGYDPIYMDVHDFNGRMDIVGPRNMNNVELAATYRPKPNATFGVTYNRFWLRDSRDGLYGTTLGLDTFPGGKLIDPTGRSGTDVGQEVDLLGKYEVNKNLFFATELGVFKPGSFIRSFTGPNTRNQWFGVIYLNVKY